MVNPLYENAENSQYSAHTVMWLRFRIYMTYVRNIGPYFKGMFYEA
jgi:hypothetical protein